MLNADVFKNYGSEKWVIEQNLCFLLQGYWEACIERTGEGKTLPRQMPLNPVGYVKEFMREETIVETGYAEMSKMDTLEKSVAAEADIIDADFREA